MHACVKDHFLLEAFLDVTGGSAYCLLPFGAHLFSPIPPRQPHSCIYDLPTSTVSLDPSRVS